MELVGGTPVITDPDELVDFALAACVADVALTGVVCVEADVVVVIGKPFLSVVAGGMVEI